MKTAKSYSNYSYDITKAYKNSAGRLVVDAQCKCDRCIKGIFPSRIENGKPIPFPVAQGVCFKCGGTGVLHKTIRLYTDEEFEKLEKANEKAKMKRLAAAEEKRKAEFANKQATWLKRYNLTLDSTFVYFPNDSYDKKEELKNAGFTYTPELMWHCERIPAGYEESVVRIPLSSIVSFSSWGEGHFLDNVKKIVSDSIKEARPLSTNSHYIAESGDKIKDYLVTLVSIHCFEGRYGFSQVVTFKDMEENIIKWFTSVKIPYQVGDALLLSGTVKKCEEDKYENNAEVTILTRCKMKNK